MTGLRLVPGPGVLGARVEGIDLARPLEPGAVRTILRALGDYGVLCFPGQDLTPAELAAFGARFGELEINVANRFHAEAHPEVMILTRHHPACAEGPGAGRPRARQHRVPQHAPRL